MKKVAILAFTLLILIVGCHKGGVKEYTGSFAEVKAQSTSLNKPILMEFFAEW